MADQDLQDFRAIIPAGGAGTRLWPVSRAGFPKFLHDLTGSGRTLLQATFDRLAPLAGERGVYVVTGEMHGAAVRDQLPQIPQQQVLMEASPRDSMAAIGLAAAVLLQREGEVVIGSFAADHAITDVATFHAAVREAVVAAREGHVVTIGIAASGPSTAFGYIEAGAELGLGQAPSARAVTSFTEKPDAATATAYLAQGNYWWNAGMFIVRNTVLLDHLSRTQPELHAGLLQIAAAWDSAERDAVVARVWPTLTKIAIDHAIAEPVAAAGGVAVVPGRFDWNDVGDFDSLAALVSPDAAGQHVVGAEANVLSLEASGGVVVAASGKQIAVLGLDDVVIVDTPDALLVTTRAHAQQVKDVVDALRGREQTQLL